MLPKDPYHVRLSGRGGQGILLAGILVAEAGMKEGYNVVQTQSYGPEARLGASRCEVILSNNEIAFPEVELPDFLLCLSRDAYVKHGRELADDGLRIVEQQVTREEKVNDALVIPMIEAARETGQEIVANVVALGVFIELTGAISEKYLRSAMEERVKPNYLDMNLKALQKGREIAKKDEVKGG